MKKHYLLIASGILNGLFTVLHCFFWNMFNWPSTLSSLPAQQQPLMPVMNIMLIFILTFFAYISLFHTRDLMETRLGKVMGFWFGGFWILRALAECIFWNISTTDSQILTAIFVLMAALSFIPALQNPSNHTNSKSMIETKSPA